MIADPFPSCGVIENASELAGRIGVVRRGECMFIDKARLLEQAGAIGGIVIGKHEMLGIYWVCL